MVLFQFKCIWIVAFVEDNATMSSIPYFENIFCKMFCAKPEEVDPIKLNLIVHKYIINNGILK